MNQKQIYIKCPRCELNYILKKDKICSVCKAEMSANKEELLDEFDLEICPVCKTNYIQPEETMCSNCLTEHTLEEIEPVSDEREWNTYVNQDETEFTHADEEIGELAIIDIDEEEVLDEDLEIEPEEEEEEEELVDEDLEDDDFDEDDFDEDEDKEEDDDEDDDF